MGILVDRSAMGRPSSVSYANRAGKIVKVVFCMNFFESSAVLLDGQFASVNRHFSDRVVSSVFEPLESTVDQWGSLGAIVKNASEDTAQRLVTARMDNTSTRRSALRVL